MSHRHYPRRKLDALYICALKECIVADSRNSLRDTDIGGCARISDKHAVCDIKSAVHSSTSVSSSIIFTAHGGTCGRSFFSYSPCRNTNAAS